MDENDEQLAPPPPASSGRTPLKEMVEKLLDSHDVVDRISYASRKVEKEKPGFDNSPGFMRSYVLPIANVVGGFAMRAIGVGEVVSSRNSIEEMVEKLLDASDLVDRMFSRIENAPRTVENPDEKKKQDLDNSPGFTSRYALPTRTGENVEQKENPEEKETPDEKKKQDLDNSPGFTPRHALPTRTGENVEQKENPEEKENPDEKKKQGFDNSPGFMRNYALPTAKAVGGFALTATGAVAGAALTATGAVAGVALTATGAATGAMVGAALSATGAVIDASITATTDLTIAASTHAIGQFYDLGVWIAHGKQLDPVIDPVAHGKKLDPVIDPVAHGKQLDPVIDAAEQDKEALHHAEYDYNYALKYNDAYSIEKMRINLRSVLNKIMENKHMHSEVNARKNSLEEFFDFYEYAIKRFQSIETPNLETGRKKKYLNLTTPTTPPSANNYTQWLKQKVEQLRKESSPYTFASSEQWSLYDVMFGDRSVNTYPEWLKQKVDQLRKKREQQQPVPSTPPSSEPRSLYDKQKVDQQQPVPSTPPSSEPSSEKWSLYDMIQTFGNRSDTALYLLLNSVVDIIEGAIISTVGAYVGGLVGGGGGAIIGDLLSSNIHSYRDVLIGVNSDWLGDLILGKRNESTSHPPKPPKPPKQFIYNTPYSSIPINDSYGFFKSSRKRLIMENPSIEQNNVVQYLEPFHSTSKIKKRKKRKTDKT